MFSINKKLSVQELACRWHLDSISETWYVASTVLPYSASMNGDLDTRLFTVERSEAKFAFRGVTVASLVEKFRDDRRVLEAVKRSSKKKARR